MNARKKRLPPPSPSIPNYLDGFDGRLAAYYRNAPSWVAKWVKNIDFPWFAKRFREDPRVSQEAYQAFRELFVEGAVALGTDEVQGHVPPSDRPASLRGVDHREPAWRTGDEPDDDPDSECGG